MRLRYGRVALLLVFVAALVAAAWVGWQTWQLRGDLDAAVDDASRLEASLRAGDQPGAQAALADLDRHAGDADGRADSATFSLLTHVPFVGDDVRGVRVASDVVVDLTDRALRPLVQEAADLESFLPREGRIPVDRLTKLKRPVAAAEASFREASRRIDAEDAGSFVGPLERKYDELGGRLRDTADALGAATIALDVMPGMLGADGPRTFLLVFQNNAELRSTGGLPGAVSVLRTDEGRLSLTRQVAANEFGQTDAPVLPLSEAERQIYGPQLGTFFLDANFTPDVPRAAELMRARWEQKYNDDVDGIVMLDPVTLAYLLEVTGPVNVDGVEISGTNAVDELLSGVYERFDNPFDQDPYLKSVARSVFTTVTSGAGSPAGLVTALGRAVQEHRLLMHSFDADEQRALAGTAIAGELPSEATSRPQVGYYLNSATASKMNYYLRGTQASVQAKSCQGGTQVLQGRVRLTSTAPIDAAESLSKYVTGGDGQGIPEGVQFVALRVYAPTGGSIGRITVDGQLLTDVPVVTHEGRPVASTFIMIEPQQTSVVEIEMTSGPRQPGDIDVSVTPSVEPVQSSSVADTSC